MSGGSGSRRNDFYDYHDSEPAGSDYVEGDVSGYAYHKPAVTEVEHKPQQMIPQGHGQQNVPMNPYLAINHGIEGFKDYKHQNTEGRRTINKGIHFK